jgi:hypothetical protein
MSLKSLRELEKYECLFAKYDKQRKQIRWNLKGIV